MKKSKKVKAKATKKTTTKRHRRTKAEMAAARGIEVNTDTPKHQPEQSKAARSVVKSVKVLNDLESDPVFMNNRPLIADVHILVSHIKEKYMPNQGFRICDRILQLCDEYEKLLMEVVKLRKAE